MNVYWWVDPQHPLAGKINYTLQTLTPALSLDLQLVKHPADAPADDPLITYGWLPSSEIKRHRVLVIEPSPQAITYFAARRPYRVADLHAWPSPEGDLPLLFAPDKALPERPDLLPDILASAFYFLSRWEESVISTRDQWERFRYDDSLYPHLGDLYPPIVDRYLDAFRQGLARLGVSLVNDSPWPHGKSFAVGLTHDVDHLTKWRWAEVRAAGGRLLRNLPRHPTKALQRLIRDGRSLLAGENPYWNLHKILSWEGARGMHSTFFILPNHHSRDADYDVDDPRVRSVLRRLTAHGAEIGLHAGFSSHGDEAETRRQLEILTLLLDIPIVGVRQHFLRLDTQKTFALYERAGIKYDSTLGFAEMPGYRSGFSYPFSPFCIAEDRPFDLLEIPLTIMDVSLGPNYQNLSAQKAWNSIEKWLSYTAKQGGCCVLLWHNSYWDELDFPGYGDLYLQILDWVAEHDGWGTSCGDIWRWWVERTQTR